MCEKEEQQDPVPTQQSTASFIFWVMQAKPAAVCSKESVPGPRQDLCSLCSSGTIKTSWAYLINEEQEGAMAQMQTS